MMVRHILSSQRCGRKVLVFNEISGRGIMDHHLYVAQLNVNLHEVNDVHIRK
jgi:hypothetical protein